MIDSTGTHAASLSNKMGATASKHAWGNIVMKHRIAVSVALLASLSGASAAAETSYYYQTRLFAVAQDQAQPAKESLRPFVVLCDDMKREESAQAEYLRAMFNSRNVILTGESKELQWKAPSPTRDFPKIAPPQITQLVDIEDVRWEVRLIPKAPDYKVIGYEIRAARVQTEPSGATGSLSPLVAVFDNTVTGSLLRKEVGTDGAVLVCFPMPGKIHVLVIRMSIGIAAAL